jgi:hypothetical protein
MTPSSDCPHGEWRPSRTGAKQLESHAEQMPSMQFRRKLPAERYTLCVPILADCAEPLSEGSDFLDVLPAGMLIHP